ncbi:MAG: type II toxin-antitoxin system prevent-host-death family antitoxin [Dermatophilaceae bacterium]
METIPHRELRNNSSAVLARVASGESIAVTNHGRVAAVIAPASESVMERLFRAHAVRPARTRPQFSRIRRVRGLDSAEVLRELRADR